MMHHFLSDTIESVQFGEIRYIAVHIAVNLNMLHHFMPVCLEAAVEVMEILDSAHFAGRGVEEFCRYSFRERVVAFLFVAAYEVVSFFLNHAVKTGNLVRTVLQIGIHCNHDITLCETETCVKSRRFAVIAAE